MPEQETRELPSGQPQQYSAAPAKRTSKLTYVIVGCVIALVAFVLLGSLLNVGDHLMDAHPALGWVFYGIICALVIIGIIVPVVKVIRRPVYSLHQIRDEKGRAKTSRIETIVDNLEAGGNLTEEETLQLRACLTGRDDADDKLIEFFDEHLVPRMDAETKRTASTAFFVSAICHSPLVNIVTMLSLCLDLVRSIVETCGFRPTNLGLAKLYTRVMLSALIIGGIEDSDLSDLFAQLLGGGAGARFGGLVIGSATEGIVSAFLVFRVGVICRKWLTTADGAASMRAIRRSSYREALSLMRSEDFMANLSEQIKHFGSTVAQGARQKAANTARSAVESMKSAFL